MFCSERQQLLLTDLRPFACFITIPATPQIMTYLNTENRTLGVLVTSSYFGGGAFGIILLAPLAELYGHRSVFLSALFGFLSFSFVCTLADSLALLVVFRFFSGYMAITASVIGYKMLGLILRKSDLLLSVRLITFCVASGSVLGPIIGSYVPEVNHSAMGKSMRLSFALTTIVVSSP
jgi:DHA1 family bicyclomycin/chloramphenicol resistance-like MFS transporter